MNYEGVTPCLRKLVFSCTLRYLRAGGPPVADRLLGDLRRVAWRRWVLTSIVILGATACGGKPDGETSQSTNSSALQQPPPSGPPLSTTTLGPTASTSGGRQPTAPSTRLPTTVPPTRPTTSAPVTTHLSTSPRTSPRADAAAKVLRPPAPGKYIYDREGSSNFGRVTQVAILTIDPSAGGRQRTNYETRDQNGKGSLERTTLEYRSAGAYLVTLRAESQTLAGQVVLDFAPSVPVAVVRHPLVKNQTSSFDLESTDRCYRSHIDVSVEEIDVVLSVGNSSYQTDVVKRVSSVNDTGAPNCKRIALTETRKTWYDSQSALPVKHEAHAEGTAFSFPVMADVTDLIRSTSPS